MWILIIIKTHFASNSLSFDTLYHSWLSYGMLCVQFMGAIQMSVYDDFMMVMMILCLIFSLTVGYCKCI